MPTIHRLVLLCLTLACGQLAKTAVAQDFIPPGRIADPRHKQITWHTSYDNAARLAASEKRPMLVQITAGWCAYCVKMSRETYVAESIIGHVNQCFVPIKIDADAHPEFLRQVNLKVLPTTLIISPDLTITQRLDGYQSPSDLEKVLRDYCRTHPAAACNPRNPAVTADVHVPCAVCAGSSAPGAHNHPCLKCFGTVGLVTWSPSAGIALPIVR